MNIVLLPEPAQGLTEFVLQAPNTLHHIQHVLQLQSGDRLKVGYLCGHIGVATIAKITPSGVYLTAIDCAQPPPKKLDLTVVLALPRPKVLRRLLMDMTAIGVAHIVLVNSYRSNKSYWQSPMLQRLDEFVQQGLEQGVDTLPPSVSLKKRFKPFVEDELRVWAQQQRAVVAHPYAQTPLTAYEAQHGAAQIICIGAEGGWIDYELALLSQHHCYPVGLGPRILRTEAAVNVLCGRYL